MSNPPLSLKPYVVMRETCDKLPVGKILAVGRNYAKHVAEMGGAPDSQPVLFFKPATAIIHTGDLVRLPAGYGQVHHEVELVAVIGRPGRRIPAPQALDHVLGFAVGLIDGEHHLKECTPLSQPEFTDNQQALAKLLERVAKVDLWGK